MSEEHSQTPAGASFGGVPGLTSNLPIANSNPKPVASAKSSTDANPTPAAEASAAVGVPVVQTQNQSQGADLSRKDIVNYKPSVREVNSVTAPVRIKRISVAAVLDGTYERGIFKPLDDARLRAIKGLVAAAVGADLERGDSVDIQSAALSQPYVAPIPNPIDQLRIFLADPVHLYQTAGAVLLALIAMIVMLKRSLARRSARRRSARPPSRSSMSNSPHFRLPPRRRRRLPHPKNGKATLKKFANGSTKKWSAIPRPRPDPAPLARGRNRHRQRRRASGRRAESLIDSLTMMNTSVAKSFAFPARNRLDVAEREAHHARNAELEAALAEGLARGFAEGLARGREAAQAEARDLLESSAREGLARGHGAGVAEMNRAADALRGALDAFNLEARNSPPRRKHFASTSRSRSSRA